jgi:hypothetical protein
MVVLSQSNGGVIGSFITRVIVAGLVVALVLGGDTTRTRRIARFVYFTCKSSKGSAVVAVGPSGWCLWRWLLDMGLQNPQLWSTSVVPSRGAGGKRSGPFVH